MQSKQPPTIFFRISTIFLFILAALPWVSPWLDWAYGVQTVLGRTNNLSMIVVFGYITTMFAIPIYMREQKERLILFLIVIFITQAALSTFQNTISFVITFGGVLVIIGSICAGLGAYSLSKSGYTIHKRIVYAITLTLPALTIPPILIAWAPDAYPEFWIKVYGFENVRAYGYFTAVVTVVLSAFLIRPASKKNLTHFFIIFASLTLSSSLLFWSGSRAGIIAMIISMLFSCAIYWRQSLAQIPIIALGLFSGLMLSTLYYTPGTWFGALNRLADTVNRLETGGIAKVSSNRIDMWQWGISESLNKPLWGHGYLSMKWLKPEKFAYSHTHNFIVEYILSFGFIFGGLALIGLFCLWLRAVIAAYRINTPTAQALLACMTLLAIYSLFSATLFFPYHSMIFMLSLGSLIGWDIYLSKPNAGHKEFRPDAKWMLDDLK